MFQSYFSYNFLLQFGGHKTHAKALTKTLQDVSIIQDRILKFQSFFYFIRHFEFLREIFLYAKKAPKIWP